MSLDWLSPEERERVLDLFRERFGVDPSRFEDYRFGRKGGDVYAVHRTAAEQGAYLNWMAAGVRLAGESRSGSLRPATQGVQAFGRFATRSVCDLDDAAVRTLLRGASLPWEGNGERGLRILRWRGHILGLGVVRNDQLMGQLPRSLTENLRPGEGGALC